MLIAISFLSSLWLLIIDYRVQELSLIGTWLGTLFFCSLIWYIILSRYYYAKKYYPAFWTMLLVIASNLVSIVLIGEQANEIKLSQYYSLLLVNIAITIHGISLITSSTSKKEILKTIGFFYSCYGVGMVLLATWMFYSLTAFGDGYHFKIVQWQPILTSIVFILFIIHFKKERNLAEGRKSKFQKLLSPLLVGFFAIATISLSILTFKTVSDISEILSHPTQTTEYEEDLAARFEAKIFLSDDKKLPYRFLQPLEYDSTKKYPLVTCLHGSSGRGIDNVKQVSRSLMATNLSTPENREKYPAFIFVPQCPPNSEWGGIGHLTEFNPLILNAIDSLENVYAIDTTRLYLTGYSMGGYGVWDLIGTHPNKFAAAVPMCGAGNPNLAKSMVDVPLWAFHGLKDRNVLVRGSRDVVKAIKEAGGDPLYTEYQNEAHNIWNNILAEPDLLPWLFSKVKK